MNGIATRNFPEVHHPPIEEADYLGPRAVMGNRYKLVLHDRRDGIERELFDLRADPAEQKNLIGQKPERARLMERQLRHWQESVLRSLSGADY